MPISINEFEKKGTAPVRIGGGGILKPKIMEYLRTSKEAFSLEEVAKATETDMKDKTANHKLMNTLYVLRGGRLIDGVPKFPVKVLLKMVGTVKYYIVTPDFRNPESDKSTVAPEDDDDEDQGEEVDE